MSSFSIQKQLIKRIKDYNKQTSKKIDPSISPYTYMTPWAESFGYYKLQKFVNKQNFRAIIYILKDLVSLRKISKLDFHKDTKYLKNKNYRNLIISYCQKSNFKNGIFNDQYFNFSSKKDDYLWFLISLDNYIPNKLSKNVYIFFNKKSHKKRFVFLTFIFKYLFKKNYGLKNFFHWANSIFFFSREIKNNLKKILLLGNFKKIIINYEAIPFQHALINEAKKFDKKIKTICYLHCAGWPFQSDLIYRNTKIDKLFVSGIDQKNNLNKFLGWPKNKVVNIASLRFSSKDKNDFGGKIFIPFKISNKGIIVKNFEKFLQNTKNKSLNKLGFRIHPLNQNSKKHQDLKKDLTILLGNYKNKFLKKKRRLYSIVFGSVTGITIQALECGIQILHFPNDTKLDVFNEVMWPNIKVEKYTSGVFKYSLKKKNRSFWVNPKKPEFQSCFNQT